MNLSRLEVCNITVAYYSDFLTKKEIDKLTFIIHKHIDFFTMYNDIPFEVAIKVISDLSNSENKLINRLIDGELSYYRNFKDKDAIEVCSKEIKMLISIKDKINEKQA